MSEEAPINNASKGAPKSSKSDDLLLQSIKKVVSVTNSSLACAEQAAAEGSTMLTSRVLSLGNQFRFVASRAIAAYDRRGQYGPQIVAGTALVVGGAFALRAGKIPGALGAGMGGAAAYGNIYGFEDYSSASWRSSINNKES